MFTKKFSCNVTHRIVMSDENGEIFAVFTERSAASSKTLFPDDATSFTDSTLPSAITRNWITEFALTLFGGFASEGSVLNQRS